MASAFFGVLIRCNLVHNLAGCLASRRACPFNSSPRFNSHHRRLTKASRLCT